MSWNESVDAAKRLGRMFEDFALVSSRFEEVANLDSHIKELTASVVKHKGEVDKAKAAIKRADEKAEQILADAQSMAAGITTEAEAAGADAISRARKAADEIASEAEGRHKTASAAAELASTRLDFLQTQIADAEIELSKTNDRLQLARDKVAAILRG